VTRNFEVLTAVKIQVDVFWVVAPCSAVVEYQRFLGGALLPPSPRTYSTLTLQIVTTLNLHLCSEPLWFVWTLMQSVLWLVHSAVYLRQVGWEGVDWMHLFRGMDQWRALVNTVMNFWVPRKAGRFLTSW